MQAARVSQEDVAGALARNIERVTYEAIPKEAAEVGKKSILDTLGVIIGASGIAPEITQVVELVKEAGGREEATIIPFGVRVPAWMAAFANGAMAHILDYDDIHHKSIVHPSSALVPAGFAVAERLGKVTGKEFITAIVLGQDLICRLALAVLRPLHIFHVTPVCGVFASAATSAKLLRLDKNGIADAFGIAFFQTAGTLQSRWGMGSNMGGMSPAFAAKGGVFSALLAQRGITGVRGCFEGKGGLFNAYFNGKYDRSALTSDLGKRFEGVNTSFKPWPACAATHCDIDAALSIVSGHDIQPEEIGEITVFAGDYSIGLCQPLDKRRRPETVVDAKYSIPFSVAVAVAKRKLKIEDYSLEGIRNPVVLRVAEKITPKLDAAFNRPPSGLDPGQVEIKTTGGKTYRKRVDSPYGGVQNPLPMSEIVEKFRDCCLHSARPLPSENVERVIQLVTNLEQLDDVAEIVRLLSPESG